MKLKANATSIFDRITNLFAFLAGALIILAMISVVADVTKRSLTGSSIVGVMEITEYSLVWITFLGTTWLLRKEKHVVMDLVINRLNQKTQSMVNLITSILCIIVCFILTWYGIEVTWEYFQQGYVRTSPLMPLYAPLLVIIPIGSFLLIIQFLRRTYGYLVNWRSLQTKNVRGD